MGFFYSDTEKRQQPLVPFEAHSKIFAKGCAACPLNHEPLRHPKMPPTGTQDPLVYILGEAPGEEEDKEGMQFVGRAGSFLRDCLPESMSEVIRWNNTLRCRPPKNREPSSAETECCRRYQVEDIERSKPVAIFGFGNVPLRWVSGHNLPITAWRGLHFPVLIGSHPCWYFPMLHPSYVIRSQGQHRGDAIEQVFRWDLEEAYKALNHLGEPVVEPKEQRAKGMQCMLEPNSQKLEDWLQAALRWDILGIDFETNKYRPYFKGRKVLTISVSNYELTYAFPYQHPEAGEAWGRKVRGLIREFLLQSQLKVAHNLSFELEWAAEEFGEDVIWDTKWGDTIAQAYILDEREGAKGLGDLTLQHFGFDVKRESNIDTNKLERTPLKEVLPYNALDAKYCYLLYFMQREQLDSLRLAKVYEEQVRRSAPIVMAQRDGLVPNREEVTRLQKEWRAKTEAQQERIRNDADVARFERGGKRFDPASAKVVLEFMRFLGHYLDDTEEETLARIKHPVAKAVVALRKANKMLSTYLDPLAPGGSAVHEDGLVHTRYNHCRTSTRRLSSEDPNSQNYPKRTHREIRVVIHTPQGHFMVCFDHGQLEARVIAMTSRDKTLVQQIWDKYDIHTDWTIRLAKRLHKHTVIEAGPKKKPFKEYRNVIKNTWTFPLFFGSSVNSVAGNLGIEASVIKEDVRDFWDTYPGVRAWQEELARFYHKHHYVETLTGFRRRAPLTWNELINQPVQGTASDIVMDGMCRLAEMAHAKKQPQLQPRLQIHDDLSFYLPDDASLEATIKAIAKEMVMCKFPFINVPLAVEVSIGRNWYEQEELTVFDSTMWGAKK